MNLIESATGLGGLRAVELACFERLGSLAPRLTDPRRARWAASSALAHAWRAAQLEDLLPISTGLPSRDELTVLPAGPLGDALARALPAAGGRDDEAALEAAVIGDLYPVLLAAYATRLAGASPAPDGPVVRVLGRVVADLRAVMEAPAGGGVGAP